MPPTESEDELKVKESIERQEEMDAIAAYGNQREFPAVANVFADTEPVHAE
jgi:hypothetical protein